MSYLVAFWNLENLFAPEGFPERPQWLADAVRKDLTGWTPALFARKVDQLASIIVQMKGGAGPTCWACARSRTASHCRPWPTA